MRARIFLDAWQLSKGIDGRTKYHDFWDEYWEFWRFNEHALMFSHIVHMAALFEKSSKTINFIQLLTELRNTGNQADLAAIDNLLSDSSATVKGIAILRNNAFAHRSAGMSYDDAFRHAKLSFDQLRELNDSALKIANVMLRMQNSDAREFMELPLQFLERLAGTVSQK